MTWIQFFSVKLKIVNQLSLIRNKLWLISRNQVFEINNLMTSGLWIPYQNAKGYVHDYQYQ